MRFLRIPTEKCLSLETEMNLNPFSLPFSSFLSNRNIKSIVNKTSSNVQSLLSANMNDFKGRKRRNEGDKSVIIGFNDMVKQLKKQVKPKSIKIDDADTTFETYENPKNDTECLTPTTKSPNSPHSLKFKRQTVRKMTVRPLRSGSNGECNKKSTFVKNDITTNTTNEQKIIIENENRENEAEEEEEREVKVKFEKKILAPLNNEENEELTAKKRKKEFNLSLFPISSKYENDSNSPFYVRSQSINDLKQNEPIRKISEFTEVNEITQIREIREIKETTEITRNHIDGTELITEKKEINMTVDEISLLAKKIHYPSRSSNILAEMSSSTLSTKEKENETKKPKNFEYKKEMVFKNTASLKSEGTLTSGKIFENQMFITDLIPTMQNYEKRNLSIHITENSERKDSLNEFF